MNEDRGFVYDEHGPTGRGVRRLREVTKEEMADLFEAVRGPATRESPPGRDNLLGKSIASHLDLSNRDYGDEAD